jgi:signal transduction histidine kinase
MLFGWDDSRHWVPDLVTGWTLIACGLVAWSRRTEERAGGLMTATGFAWFAANFAVTGIDAIDWLSRHALYLHRGPLVQLVLTYPRGTPVGRFERFPTHGAKETSLLVYQAALCALAIALLAGLIRAPWERAAVTDLVVELGEVPSATLRDALARALGDPTLDVGYWVPQQAAYVDASGRRFDLPPAGAVRRVTRIDRDGQPLAALVHDPSVFEDPGLVDAVAAAARLAAANARLQADVRAKADEVAASRRRLLHAGDEERRRLEERLREGAERRLSALLHRVDDAVQRRGADDETVTNVQRVQMQLAQTLRELRELASGLHPRELSTGGLPIALASLAERSAVPVCVTAPPERLPTEVEAALYFVCSEALANVAKYASASSVQVGVTVTDGRVRIEIEDDGVGGADPARGSGLRGLVDRIEALDGRFEIASAPGSGTRLTAELPLERQSA